MNGASVVTSKIDAYLTVHPETNRKELLQLQEQHVLHTIFA